MSVPTTPPYNLTARSLYGMLRRLIGASIVGIEDTAGYFTGGTVEEALAELGAGVALVDVKAVAGDELTIAGGIVTATNTYHTIDTQGDAASDDLDTISGLADGQFYVFSIANAARNVVFKHGTGNIKNPSGRDITLDVTNDKIFGFSDGTSLFVLDMSLTTSAAGGLASALAAVTNGQGASLVGIEDALTLLTATTVESALAELAKYEMINLADPGTGVAIPVTRSATIEITTAAAETNTLAIPTFLGQRLLLVLDVRAVGNRVITVAARINTAGNTIITLDTAGDAIMLVAIKIGGVFRWQVVFNDGAALS